MDISGKKNLSLVKRALLSHTVYCSTRAIRSSDNETKDIWDPELKETQDLLAAVEINLGREEVPQDSPGMHIKTD